jgi:hypothetical protein
MTSGTLDHKRYLVTHLNPLTGRKGLAVGGSYGNKSFQLMSLLTDKRRLGLANQRVYLSRLQKLPVRRIGSALSSSQR